MRTCKVTAVAVLCLLLTQGAAAEKTGANGITVLGDGLEFSAGSVGQSYGTVVVDGALGGVAYGEPVLGTMQLEAGFYSRMVSSPSVDYNTASTFSYTLALAAANPQGTTYDVFVSTWELADPYMAYYSTDASGRPVEGLYPDTSFYNFVQANYMDGDYAAFAATAAVTLAAEVSSGTFRFDDVGHNTLNLSFSAFENPWPAQGPGWGSTAYELAAARYGQASVVYGSHVFISGGFNGISPSSAVYRAELTVESGLGAWQPAGFMPEALYGHQLAAARGRLYVIGGRTQSAIRSLVWSADVSSLGVVSAWEPEAALDYPLYFHAAAAAGNWLHVSGGYATGGVSAGILSARFNEAGRITAWDDTYTLPAPRYAHTMTYLADRLYVIGGRDGASARSQAWVYSLGTDGENSGSYTDYTSLPAARYGHITLAAANALYVIGGNNGSTAQMTVFVSSAAAAAGAAAPWLPHSPLGVNRQFAAGAALGGTLYVLGGSDGGAPSKACYYNSLSATRYVLEASSDETFALDLHSSGLMSGYNWSFAGLQPGVSYYVRAKAVNSQGFASAYSQIGSTVTCAAIPGPAAWSDVYVTSATLNWLFNGNPSGTTYLLEYSSNTNYVPSNTVQDVSGLQYYEILQDALQQNTTYYARVRVYASPGGASRFIDLPPVFTSFDPAMDIDSPTVHVVMDEVVSWRSTNTFGCDVDFDDSGSSNSGLDRFEVKSSTANWDTLASWTPALSGINQGVYTQDWTIPQGVWEAMMEGASNYISLQVVDRVGNTTTYMDAFSVLKDTTPPVIISNYVAPAGLLTVYPGDVDSLRFEDALSGLYRAQYSVSTDVDYPGAEVIGWTTIAMPALTAGATFYEPIVSYDFVQLANAPANYFSFRAVDIAGSTHVYKSVFAIGKNVSGPGIAITAPAGLPAYLSTFTAVAGNTTETNGHVVQGTEISLFDMTAGKYYTGSAFTGGSRVWFDAADVPPAFTYTFNNLPLVGGRQYQAVARSSDSAGDYSQSFATYTFTYDVQPPGTQVLAPVNGAVYSGAVFSGSAADSVSGLSAVDIALKSAATGKWWDGAMGWNTDITTLPIVNAADWTYTFPPHLRDNLVHGASYYITARAMDQAVTPNEGRFGVTGSTFTCFDATPPPQTTDIWPSESGQRGVIKISWTTVGDNDTAGYLSAGAYKIAYSTYAGAVVSTSAAQVSIPASGLTAGTTQTTLIANLAAGASYYVTLWTADDVPNWSQASAEIMAVASVLNSGGLTGRVTDASAQAVNGVLVEALGATGAVEGSDYTDNFGNYSISGLNSEVLSVRAVLTAQDIESSVTKGLVPNGAAGVDFTLSASYQLASISGFIPAGFMPQRYTMPAGARYTTREVRPEPAQPFVEIYKKGRRIGTAFVDAGGGFAVGNLLPGTYGVRVYNGTDFSAMATVKLQPGENLMFTPKFDLLNKDSVFVYPNPANTLVNFHFEPAGTITAAQVEVFDIAGRLVKTLTSYDTDVIKAPGKSIVWDISRERIASGVYVFILRIKDNAGAAAKPVIKKFAVIR